MALFLSDNVTCACPEVMEAVNAANSGDSASYGNDIWTSRLQARLSEIFETEVRAFPVVTGTASNALALSALAPAFGKIYCHALSHINTDECAAPEFFTGGAKLIPLPGEDGKITAEGLAAGITGKGNVHQAQPSAISISQACETGTVYGVEDICGIAATAHEAGLSIHMDGARFANALVSLGVSPAEMTWKAGVDILSLGGTKNGCLAAEAVVFFGRDRVDSFAYLHKRAGQLLSKMRFVSAQLVAYFTDDVWLRNARHANDMARHLSEGLSNTPGIKLAYPTQSNEVFVRLPRRVIECLGEEGFEVKERELDGSVARFVTAWDTRPADVERLLSVVARQTTTL